mmetsp:Transcript_440/g.1564  ORF Transcript_440/g.1564 Transcript_440/m.1564 type:complete len:288 (-) Transcript_440:805-1668(-)
MMTFAPISSAVCALAAATDSNEGTCHENRRKGFEDVCMPKPNGCGERLPSAAPFASNASASPQISAMADTASNGYFPAAVSPDSMTQSVPSMTALATSVASALVGLGAPVMDSNICVAVMTGFPASLHLRIILFCAKKICSMRISIPKSPRATITPSDLFTMSSKLSKPSMFSTFAIIPIFLPGVSPTTSRMTSMSDPFLTKEAAMKSTLFFTPQFKMSSLSFSVIVGKFTFTLGKFMFFRSPSMAEFSHLHTTSPFRTSVSRTFKVIDPSAHKILLPRFTSLARSG